MVIIPSISGSELEIGAGDGAGGFKAGLLGGEKGQGR